MEKGTITTFSLTKHTPEELNSCIGNAYQIRGFSDSFLLLHFLSKSSVNHLKRNVKLENRHIKVVIDSQKSHLRSAHSIAFPNQHPGGRKKQISRSQIKFSRFRSLSYDDVSLLVLFSQKKSKGKRIEISPRVSIGISSPVSLSSLNNI